VEVWTLRGCGLIAGGTLRSIPSGSNEQAASEARDPSSALPVPGQPIGIGKPERPSLDEVLAAGKHDLVPIAARYLQEASKEEVMALAEAWEFKVGVATPRIVWKLMLARQLDFDPMLALNSAAKLGQRNYEPYVYQTWAAKDLAAALEDAEADPGRLLKHVIGATARQNMPLALKLVERYPDVPGLSRVVLSEMAKSDPLTALKFAEEIANDRQRDAAVTGVIQVWGETSSGDVFRQIESMDVSAIQRISRHREATSLGILSERFEGETRPPSSPVARTFERNR
jgi:hypothetical protein